MWSVFLARFWCVVYLIGPRSTAENSQLDIIPHESELAKRIHLCLQRVF